MKREYTNGEITVLWDSDLCIHSTKCFKGLPEVFNPQKRPWITMNEDSAAISAQVLKCPSGALSLKMDILNPNTEPSVEKR